MWSNKTLQATAAALCALAVAMSQDAVVAEVSALPAAVPELVVRRLRARMRLGYLIKIAAVLVGLSALGSLLFVFRWDQSASTIIYAILFAVLAISGFIGWSWMFHARAKSIIQKWASKHGYVVLQFESPFRTGAFSWLTTSRGQIVYCVTIRDGASHERKAWVRCGSYIGSVLFSDEIEVRWQDETKAA